MCDFLPVSVHEILNDLETSLSLPMLVVIGLCTLQFAITHSMHIACNVKEILRKRSEKKRRQRKCVKEGPGLIERIKAMFCKKKKPSCPLTPRKCIKKPACKRSCNIERAIEDFKKSNHNDWDDEDDDEMDDMDD